MWASVCMCVGGGCGGLGVMGGCLLINRRQKEDFGPVKGKERRHRSQVRLSPRRLHTRPHLSGVLPASPSVRCPLWRLYFPSGTAGGQWLRKYIFLNTLPFIPPLGFSPPPDGFALFLDDSLESTRCRKWRSPLRKHPHRLNRSVHPPFLHPVRSSSAPQTNAFSLAECLSARSCVIDSGGEIFPGTPTRQ